MTQALMISLVIKGTLLLGLAFLLDRMLRRRWVLLASAVWNAVLVGLLILPVATVLLQTVELPLLPARPMDQFETPPMAKSEISGRELPSPAANDKQMLTDVPDAGPLSPGLQTAENGELALSSPGTIWRSWAMKALFLVYGAGLLAVLARLLGSWRAVRTLLRRSRDVTNAAWNERFDVWSRAFLGCPSVRLLESDDIDVPVALGLFRPAIVIPTSLVAEPKQADIDTVLVHEMAHIVRSDNAWLFVERFAEAIWWYHPLVWLMRTRIAFVREQACDAFSVYAIGDAALYVDSLVRIASAGTARRAFGLGLAVVLRTNIARRLAYVQQTTGEKRCVASRTARLIITLGTISATVLVAVLVIGRAAAEPLISQVADSPGAPSQGLDTLNASPDTEGEPKADAAPNTLKDILERASAAAQDMTPYDVRLTVTLSWLMKSIEVDAKKDPDRPNVTRKLEWAPWAEDEKPKSVTKRFRQVLSRDGKSRIVEYGDEVEQGGGSLEKSIIVDDGSTQRVLNVGQNGKPNANIRRSHNYHFPVGDEYLTYSRNLAGLVPLPVLASERPETCLVSEAKQDPDLVGIRLPAKNGPSLRNFEFRVWLDRRFGLLPRRIQVYRNDGAGAKLYGEMEVIKFHEFEPGKWAPIDMAYTNYNIQPGSYEGKVVSVYHASVPVEQSRWNQPVDDELFLLPYPAGLSVTDFVNAQIITTGPGDDGRDLQALAKNAARVIPTNTPETLRRQQADLDNVREQDREPGKALRKYGAFLKAGANGAITSVDFIGAQLGRRGFGEPGIDDAGLQYIARLDKLEHLGLDNTQITDAGLGQLRGLTNLKELALTNTDISDEGVKQLNALENLEWLWLDNNFVQDGKRVRRVKITDEALRHLLPLKRLTHLQLYGTAVSDAGLEFLKDLPNLQQVSLQGSDVTREGAQKLRAARPRLRVLVD